MSSSQSMKPLDENQELLLCTEILSLSLAQLTELLLQIETSLENITKEIMLSAPTSTQTTSINKKPEKEKLP